jgi:hypothetical protein
LNLSAAQPLQALEEKKAAFNQGGKVLRLQEGGLEV